MIVNLAVICFAALVARAPALATAHTSALAPSRTIGSRSARAAHDLHLTYARVVVDGAVVKAKVRVFKDDMERGLAGYARTQAFQLGASTTLTDSLFAAYFNARTSAVAGGRRVVFKVTQSGRDPDATDPVMWSFELEGRALSAIRDFSLRVSLLFETFEDQKNVVTLIRMPGEDRHSLYFSASDSSAKRVSWPK